MVQFVAFVLPEILLILRAHLVMFVHTISAGGMWCEVAKKLCAFGT
jgi:hypothetical protein